MDDDHRRLLIADHVLDHQIVSADDRPVGKVDDVLLEELVRPGEPPYVTGLLTGQIAFGRRLGGRLGRWTATVAERLRNQAGTEPRRLDISLIRHLGHTVVLGVPSADLPQPDLERWLSDNIIGRLPGAGA